MSGKPQLALRKITLKPVQVLNAAQVDCLLMQQVVDLCAGDSRLAGPVPPLWLRRRRLGTGVLDATVAVDIIAVGGGGGGDGGIVVVGIVVVVVVVAMKQVAVAMVLAVPAAATRTGSCGCIVRRGSVLWHTAASKMVALILVLVLVSSGKKVSKSTVRTEAVIA